MRAAEIAKACGGAYRSGSWWRCVCPVHGSRTGRGTTLSLRDGEAGHGIDTERSSDGKPRSESAKRVNGQNSGSRAGAGVGYGTVK